MKKAIVGLIALVAVAGASAATTNFLLLPPAAPAGQFVQYGHVKKLTKSGSHYVLRFDPAWFTSGITASVAHKEDTGSNQGTKGISATPISAAELYRIVNGGPHHKLYEPLESGIWIRVRIDTVKELDQQYQP